jgi:hypothetical protein
MSLWIGTFTSFLNRVAKGGIGAVGSVRQGYGERVALSDKVIQRSIPGLDARRREFR